MRIRHGPVTFCKNPKCIPHLHHPSSHVTHEVTERNHIRTGSLLPQQKRCRYGCSRS